tara:strand:- start:416 stop:1444 length:1029 start_codon:yes stop_codon:yes gene_type:complete
MSLKKPYLIAEISANHNGSISMAKRLIKCAKVHGADAVKLQTYTADSMTLNSKKSYFKLKNGLWKNYFLWDLYDQAKTPINWHKKLFEYARKINIEIFSTPFDEWAVDFLEELSCPIYKVASYEMTDFPLIKKIIKTQKPIIISTGSANINEISETVDFIKKNGGKKITILYCVSNYPSKNTDFHFNNIKILKKKFECTVGFSDHSRDNRIAMAAVAAGAEVIEKHIALDKQKKGFDLEFSLKGKELRKYRNDIDLINSLFQKKNFFRSKKEVASKIHRRSIFISKNIEVGETFTKNNIRRIRPGYGIEPKFYEKLLGKKCPVKLYANEPLKKNILEKLNIK